MTFKLARAERDASSYQPVPEIDPAQNPLLRKYNMADRTQTVSGVSFSAMASETVNIGMGLDFAKDDYTESDIGLISAEETSVNFDISALLSETASMHLFVSRQQINSRQAGSQSVTTADWFADNQDIIDTAGIGIKHRMLEDRLDIGADYVVSRSTGKINILSGAPEDFPDLETDLDSIRVYAHYRLKDNMTLRASYWYERYDTRDWMLDGVNADTINNVLGFGEVSPSYNVNVLTVSLTYKF